MEKIVPPRLEDAGLEDCALPPESIAEAFRRAATAVRSRAFSLFPAADEKEEERSGCVQDPMPEDSNPDAVVLGGWLPKSGSAEDLIVGGEAAMDVASGNCVVEKGGGVVEEGKDAVVVVGGDAVEGKGSVCGGGGGSKTEKDTSEEEEGAEDEGPRLAEGFVA